MKKIADVVTELIKAAEEVPTLSEGKKLRLLGRVYVTVKEGWDLLGEPARLQEPAEAVDVISFEFENVSAEGLDLLASIKPVRPAPAILRISQDRLVEKAFLNGAGAATAPWAPVETLADLQEAAARLGLPAVLKTTRLGYDGKGQAMLRTPDDLAPAFERLQLLTIEHVRRGPGREQQVHRHAGPVGGPAARDGHQRDQARTAPDQQDRAAVLGLPDEMAAQGPLDLDDVADLRDVMEPERNLAVGKALDRQLHFAAGDRKGGDRIASDRAVAVLGGQPDVDVLPGPPSERPIRADEEARDPRRLHDAADDGRVLPSNRRRNGEVSHRCTAVPARGRRRCDSRAAPRSRPRRGR